MMLMLKPNKYFFSILLLFIFIFIGTLCSLAQTFTNQPISFESFLNTNLTIESVIFTRESFLPSSPHNKQGKKLATKEILLVRVSGADYLLSVLKNNAEASDYIRAGVDAGRFNGNSWHYVNNTLVIADSNSGQTDPQDSAIKASVGMVAKLGITTFIGSDSFTYDKDNNRYELANTNVIGGKAFVQLNYSNGIVISATIKGEPPNKAVNYVAYSYDSGFFNGRIPVEFNSFLEMGETTIKLFTIHILQLSITNNSLPRDLIDPTLAFNSKELKILASRNGSLYTQAGTRVLTTKEIFEKKPAVAKHIIYIRIVLVLIMASGLLIILVRTNKKTK